MSSSRVIRPLHYSPARLPGYLPSLVVCPAFRRRCAGASSATATTQSSYQVKLLGCSLQQYHDESVICDRDR